MNWLRISLVAFCVCGLALCVSGIANAATVDSSAFAWKYEFEGATANTPDNLDIDGNSSPDMMLYSGSAGSVAGGVMTITEGTAYIDDFGWKPALVNGIWKANSFAAANGFTIEARIKVNSQSASLGATTIAAGPEPAAGAPDSWLNIGASTMRWTGDNVSPMDTSDNTDGFHTFRIALNPTANAYDIWRDDVQVGSNLPDVYSPSYNGLDRLYIGNISPAWANGVTEWDYLRFTEGYFPGTVPEPGTVVLLATGLIGLLAYAWRKRK